MDLYLPPKLAGPREWVDTHCDCQCVCRMLLSVQSWDVDRNHTRALIDGKTWSGIDEEVTTRYCIENGIINAFILVHCSHCYNT